VVVGGLWLVDYVAVNGFDFNPIPAPNRLR